MDVINWLAVKPTDSDLKRAADKLDGSAHMRVLLQSLVRAILESYPWSGRTDLVSAFDPSRRYDVGQQVAMFVHDPQGLRPDTWRIARVKAVADAENPVQGAFQVVTLSMDRRDRIYAGGVSGARPSFPAFPPADDESMSWLVADIADHFYEPLADVVRRAAAAGRLNIRVVGDQVSRLDTQPTFGEREALLVARLFRDVANRPVPYRTTDEILEALRADGRWRDVPDDVARTSLGDQLPRHGYCSVGNDRWMTAEALASAQRDVIRRPMVPVVRSKLLQEQGMDDSADFDDYEGAPLRDREMAAALEELGEIKIEKPPAGRWRPPAAPIAVGALTYQHIVQGFLPLGRFADAFPPEPDPLLVDVALVEGDPIPCWISRQEGVLKATDAEQWRRRFLELGIPAGTKLWLEYKGGTSYRIAPRPLTRPQSVRCKLACLEEGRLHITEADIEIRYESDPCVFKAELRFEDVEALFREAEVCGYSIFDIMYQEFCRLAALHPERKVHQRDLFNAVFLCRMCSPRSVVTELYTRACFVRAGNGWFRLDESQGYGRRYGKKVRQPRRRPPTAIVGTPTTPHMHPTAGAAPGAQQPVPPPAPEPVATPETDAPEAAAEAEAPPEAAAEAEAPPEVVAAPEPVAAPEAAAPEPVAEAEAPTEVVAAPEAEDTWSRAARLVGREFHTPRTGQPFRVSRITDVALHIALPNGQERHLKRVDIEGAWQHLAKHRSITKGEIRQFCTEQDACYLGPILAALAGGTLVVRRDCSLSPAPPAETPTPPPERTRKGQLVMSDVVAAGPLFEPPAEPAPESPRSPLAQQPPHVPPESPANVVSESPIPPRAAPARPARPPWAKRNDMQAKTLFSSHYLETRLPEHPEWREDPRPVFDAVRALWQKAQKYGDSWNEAQTEQEFVKPVLDILGWAYVVQAKSQRASRTSRPDYALFADEARRDDAYPYQGRDDAFYSRALAIAEAKYWGRPLSQKDAERGETWKEGNPSHQMVSYLVGTRAPWGILTNGRVWRLYSREVSSTASEFYEVDLGTIFDVIPAGTEPDAATLDAFRRWWLFFRRDAFVPDAQGKSFVQRVHEGSATYARQISDKLKDLVFRQVVPEIAGGFVAYRYHQKGIREETDATLREIYAATLSLLYKLLFLLYAEARSLLPINDPGYRGQSLTALCEWAAECLDRDQPLSDATHATPKYDALLALFRRIDQGDPSLGIPRYNGGLFSPDSPENHFLETHRLSDRAVARAIDTLRRDAGQPVDYAYISVRNLGAIYEGLLENRLRVVDAERGQVELVNDKGERKATGSYYTPDYIVEYIVRHTLDPILDERNAAFRAAMDRIAKVRGELAKTLDADANRLLRDQLEDAERDAREAFLGIKVLDPAMGSGHFLVNAVDHLTDGIIQRMQAYHDEHPSVPWDWNPIQRLIDSVRREILAEMERQSIRVDARRLDDTAILTRIVMKRCIYGVDLNPLAVELAKLSLWLHSFTVGAPLSFLDHHLRWGNSLIGTDVRTVQREIQMKRAGEAQQYGLFAGPFSGLLDLTAMMLDVAERADATLADVRQSAETFEQFQKQLTPYKQVLDLWVSQYFGNKAAYEFLTVYGDDVMPALRDGKGVAPQYEDAIARARELWKEKRFFHWDLEFPEAFVDLRKRNWAENPGFDAVIGNPPYGRYGTMDEDSRGWIRELGLAFGSGDTAEAFTSQGLRITRRSGWLAFVLPKVITYVVNWEAVRAEILTKGTLQSVLDLGKAFEGVLYEQVVLCIRLDKPISEEPLVVTVPDQEQFVSYVVPRDLVNRRMFRIAADTCEQSIIRKMDNVSDLSGTIYEVWYGKGGAVPHLRTTGEVRVLQGRDVDRFGLLQGDLPTTFLESRQVLPDELRSHRRRKVVAQDIVAHIENPFPHIRLAAHLDEDGLFCLNTLTCFAPREGQPYDLGYLLSLLNSKLISWYSYVALFNRAVRTMHFMPGYADRVPIRRISFTTPPERRAALVDEARRLYEGYLASGDPAPVLSFVSERLATQPEESDVVHDLLAHLAGQMIELNKQKQAEMKEFLGWLERECGVGVDALTGKSRIRNYLGDYQKGEDPLSLQELLDILRKNARRLKVDPSARKFQEALAREYQTSLDQLVPVKKRLAATDRLIDLVVYRLYGLTEEEIAIVEGRAT